MPKRIFTKQCKECAKWDECDYYAALEEIEDAIIAAELEDAAKDIWWLLDCPDREERES